jgi:hypothetical protein
MNWYIGQKVVAVRDGHYDGKRFLIKDKEYVISAFGFQPDTATHYSFNFIELVGMEDYRWWETAFRPLEENFAEETLSKAKSDADEILEIMETLQEAVK